MKQRARGLRVRTATSFGWAGPGSQPIPRGGARRRRNPRWPSLHFPPLAAQRPLAGEGRLESEEVREQSVLCVNDIGVNG